MTSDQHHKAEEICLEMLRVGNIAIRYYAYRQPDTNPALIELAEFCHNLPTVIFSLKESLSFSAAEYFLRVQAAQFATSYPDKNEATYVQILVLVEELQNLGNEIGHT